jgi:class 3 adenylate cyclase
MTVTSPSLLGPYVPRVVREWLDDDAAAVHRTLAGTIVFVDVSGFTKMSERLARFGKAGAEAVTDVIGSCFNRLLTEAYAFGATLLKFGGDALLLFFEGEAHAVRGCSAALEMRRVLRQIGTFDTRAGRVTLRMSVGVHSGQFDFFLVGDSHRELILSGAAATEAVGIEAAAGTGRILVSPAVAADLPPSNRGPRSGPGYLLRGSPPVVGEAEVQFLGTAGDLTPYLPVALRDVVASTGAQPEHRRVTVAFIHFGGVDELISRSGPAAAADALGEVMGSVQRAIDPRRVCFLGTDIAAEGGKVILTSGAPISVGEDEEQMLLALRSFVESAPPLPVRIGVNGGHVFAGEVGTIHRRTYTVMGDAVNLAARLMAKAGPGEILATRPVLRASRTLFDTHELEPFLVKGKREPVIALTVGAPQGVRAGIASSDLPLVGRDEELAIALDALDHLRTGRGCLLDLTAEPGVGKSRFVDEIVRRAGATGSDGIAVHRVECRQYQVTTPYFPFTDLLRDLLGLSGLTDAEALAGLAKTVRSSVPHLVPWLSLIAIPFALDDEDSPEAALLGEEFRKQQLERSVVELLMACITAPTMICFEDTHWMDEASGDLLRALERALAERPWLLCIARRDVQEGFVPAGGEHTIRVDLPALGPEATAALLAAATSSAPLPGHIVQALAERSDGNPLFALELLDALRSEGDLEALPGSVEGLISARIDRLSAEEKALLRHVSVLGVGFWADHIPAVAPEVDGAADATLARLGDLLEVRETGWVTFRHNLVRDVAYAGLPFRVRSRLHGHVAESILRAATDDPGDQAALLSLHFHEAHRFAEAWRFARLAGDSAREIYANVEAITLYQRALQAARQLADLPARDRAEALEALGDAQDLAGLYDDARASYRAARRLLADDPVLQARLALKDAFVAERRGRYGDAVRSIRRGQRLLAGVDEEEAGPIRSQLTVWFAAMRAYQGKTREAARLSRAGIELAEASGDESALARAFLVLDYAEDSLGTSADARYSSRALEIYCRLGDLSGEATAANALGLYAYHDGRWGRAIELYERSREARRKTGDPVNAAMADANIAEILTEQGRLEEAEDLLRTTLAVWIAAGDEWGVAFAKRALGTVTARAGRYDDATQLLKEARAEFAAIGAQADVVLTELAVAEALVLAGTGDAALRVLGRVLADGEPAGLEPFLPALHRLWGLALLQTGDDELGHHELGVAVTLARRRGAEYQLALALEALERLGAGSADAEDHEGILDRLGVVSRPAYPLPAAVTEG